MLRQYADGDSTSLTKLNMGYLKEYNYLITAADKELIDNAQETLKIDLPEDVDNHNLIIIYSVFGRLEEDYHWKFTAPRRVEFYSFNMGNLLEGDMLSFEIYRDENL